MRTEILPGFFPKNKKWLEDIQAHLVLDDPVHIIEWPHWQTLNNSDFSVEKEVDKLIAYSKSKPFNIIAKSVGTLIAVKVLDKLRFQVQKVILCGIPMDALNSKDKEAYQILAQFYKELLVIQNENDNHGSFQEAKEFLMAINSQIKIESKLRDDHEYPYFEDFQKFLE